MRVTIHLEDDVLTEAKRWAAARDLSLSELVERSLRAELARRESPPACRGSGLLPGVNLDDSSELLDWMERLSSSV